MNKTFLLRCKDCKNVFGSIFNYVKCLECNSENTKVCITVTEN